MLTCGEWVQAFPTVAAIDSNLGMSWVYCELRPSSCSSVGKQSDAYNSTPQSLYVFRHLLEIATKKLCSTFNLRLQILDDMYVLSFHDFASLLYNWSTKNKELQARVLS